jgi:L-amino acid N-acyltransferase YncA
MADDIVIVEAKPEHLSRVETWAARNDAVKTLLKTPKDPSAAVPEGWHWAALRGDEVVSVASVELSKEHVGYLNCIVKPGELRQGIGSRMIEYVLAQPQVKNLVHLHAVIEPANTAARKILNQNGFSRVGYDANGHIEFARHAHGKNS